MEAALIPTTSPEEFIVAGAAVLERVINAAIVKEGQCVLGLSGGLTPGPVYKVLGISKTIDWERVSIFLVDERYVPDTDERSNTFLVRNTLLSEAPIPDIQCHFPDTSLPIDECVKAYDEKIRLLLPDSGPDVVVLGMGDDGHIASLFPPLSAGDLAHPGTVIHTEAPNNFPVKDRISVTFRILRTASSKVFLLSGEKKKKVWEETIKNDASPLEWPASLLLHHAFAVTKW